MLILNIIWPTFAMVLLVFAVWFTLVLRRMSHVKRNPPSREVFASNEAFTRYFQPVEMPAANLANLFEMPVLYFALVPLLLITQQASIIQVMLAWAFVLLRAVHSAIHLGRNAIRPRSLVYFVSVAVLMAMWLGFMADMGHAAWLYHNATQGLPIRS